MGDLLKAAWRLLTVTLDVLAYCVAWGVLAWILTRVALELAFG